MLVLADAPGPAGNVVIRHNVITGNSTDILDTGSGSGNVYRNNVCGANPGACR